MTVLRGWSAAAPFDVTDTTHDKVKPSECAVYRFRDAEDRLLYVGVAWNPGRRWERHRRESAWFKDAVSVTVFVFAAVSEALAVERAMIRQDAPLHNKRSARR